MSSANTHSPLVKSVNYHHSQRLLEYNGFDVIGSAGYLSMVNGFDSYNHLVGINRLFAREPKFDIVDRTGRITGPIKYAPVRPWSIPGPELTLEQALENRVLDICALGQRVNLFWSGGIDSTAFVVAFLRHADHRQLRIIYTPWSTYEHPEFFRLLQKIGDVDLVDLGANRYFDCELDGVFVSGNSSDEAHACVDESFFFDHGYDFLFTPWKDFFYGSTKDHKFIEFCEYFFSAAERDIDTILEARWWFYVSTRLTGILYSFDLPFFTATQKGFDPGRLIGFFDFDAYEQFTYYNIDRLLYSRDYESWKQFLKDYCYDFDGFADYRVNKSKFHSHQLILYTLRKSILADARNLMILDDGTQVSTPNLPLFSQSEWNKVKHQYQHLFETT